MSQLYALRTGQGRGSTAASGARRIAAAVRFKARAAARIKHGPPLGDDSLTRPSTCATASEVLGPPVTSTVTRSCVYCGCRTRPVGLRGLAAVA